MLGPGAALVTFGIAAFAEFLTDTFIAVNNVLDAISTAVRPAADQSQLESSCSTSTRDA